MHKELENSLSLGLGKTEPVALGAPPLRVAEQVSDALAIDLDIESADKLPPSDDPWSEPLYVENFTRAEMAWCLHRPDARPYYA
jgi:hypothetical protein